MYFVEVIIIIMRTIKYIAELDLLNKIYCLDIINLPSVM